MSKAAFAGLKGVQEMRFVLCQTGKAGRQFSKTPTRTQNGARRTFRDGCSHRRADAHVDARTQFAGEYSRPSYEHVVSAPNVGFRPFNVGRVVVLNDPRGRAARA
jgi:hypothetical protein